MLTENTNTKIRDAVVELIRRTSTQLPPDVLKALLAARRREATDGTARATLTTLLENENLAQVHQAPLCQDTGTLTFYGRVPPIMHARHLQRAVQAAVGIASRRGYLRQNTIDTLTDRSVRDNRAPDVPICHWEPARGNRLELRLLMKGGGCENMSVQYSLPDARLAAGRDLSGVRRCILDAVNAAQGHGCAPGILGVCIGGDRGCGYEIAKRQFLRPLSDRAPEASLAALEQRSLREANTLGIGPMGLGGRTTLLAVKIAAASRLPASYFVTVAYMCWALRRGGLRLTTDGTMEAWLQA